MKHFLQTHSVLCLCHIMHAFLHSFLSLTLLPSLPSIISSLPSKTWHQRPKACCPILPAQWFSALFSVLPDKFISRLLHNIMHWTCWIHTLQLQTPSDTSWLVQNSFISFTLLVAYRDHDLLQDIIMQWCMPGALWWFYLSIGVRKSEPSSHHAQPVITTELLFLPFFQANAFFFSFLFFFFFNTLHRGADKTEGGTLLNVDHNLHTHTHAHMHTHTHTHKKKNTHNLTRQGTNVNMGACNCNVLNVDCSLTFLRGVLPNILIWFSKLRQSDALLLSFMPAKY